MGNDGRRGPLRAFGFGGGRQDRDRDRFEELTVVADEAGVRWHDLTSDGYRVAGDMYVGGILVSYDWRWRVAELERRLALQEE
jgi:hypothetical protein